MLLSIYFVEKLDRITEYLRPLIMVRFKGLKNINLSFRKLELFESGEGRQLASSHCQY